jgi:hypothetical protein
VRTFRTYYPYLYYMPTKRELYALAKKKKEGKCPKISKYTKTQLAAFISGSPNPKQSKKFVVDDYLKKQLTQMKRTYSKYGGPQDAQAKKKIGSITAQVHDNSPFGDPFLPWSTNTTSNRTRKLSNKTSIRKLSNNDVATIHIITNRLELPPAKQKMFQQVAVERGLYNYIIGL